MSTKFGISLVIAAGILCRASEPAAARWEGAVQIPGLELRVVIDLAQDSQGQWVGSATVPGFGVKGAPLTGIAIKDSDVTFAMKGALGEPRFKGQLTANGSLTGEYQQAGNTAPFTLQKTGPPQVDPPRESTAVRKEMAGEWQGTMTYAGNEIRVRLKLENQSSGKATGQFVFVGKKENVFPIDLVTQEADMLTVDLIAIGVSYEGRLQKGEKEIVGTFHQGAMEIPLNLQTVAKP